MCRLKNCGPPATAASRNLYFRYINRNKKGITLDYEQPEGKALFLRLVETTDVLVENYRPTVMPRAGLGFDALREVNPRADLRPALRARL